MYGYSSFHYEKSAKPDNKYHGNLLMKNELQPQLKDMIRSMLAINVSEIIKRQ